MNTLVWKLHETGVQLLNEGSSQLLVEQEPWFISPILLILTFVVVELEHVMIPGQAMVRLDQRRVNHEAFLITPSSWIDV